MEAVMSEVFIYCDDASHARKCAVGTFRQGSGGLDGRWLQVLKRRGKAGQGRESRGVTLRPDNTLALPADSPEEAVLARQITIGPDLTGSDPTRSRFQFRLVCRKCKDRPLEVRSEKLSPLLDALVLQGVSEVPLTLIAAMLTVQSRQVND
jgi:hypothetical protein